MIADYQCHWCERVFTPEEAAKLTFVQTRAGYHRYQLLIDTTAGRAHFVKIPAKETE
jgi:hypothetical protein